MIALLCFLVILFASPFKSKSRLEAENAALRRQLIIFPSVLKTITIIRPETLVRWHRAGVRRYWRWKSRSLGGRPQVDADLRSGGEAALRLRGSPPATRRN
jgi:hypothetical protein